MFLQGILVFLAASLISPRVSALPEVQLTTDPADDMEPAWSPDGTHIAFVSTRRGNADIWVIPAKGGDATQLTFNLAPDLEPTWSPDGSQIAFSSLRSGNWDIWVVPSGGGDARQITAQPSVDFSPAWSRDGHQIAFTSWQATMNICLIPASGGEVLQVTRGEIDAHPTWSPDGMHIAFESSVASDAPIHILTIPTSGGTTHTLTTVGMRNHAPDWTPHGHWIAFMSDVGAIVGQFQIWMIRDSGDLSVRLSTATSPTQSDEDPAWSPDGTRVAYESWRSGTADIWIISDVQTAITAATWTRLKSAYR